MISLHIDEEKLTKALNLWDLEDAITEIHNNMVRMEQELKFLHQEKEKLLLGHHSSEMFMNSEEMCCPN